ncbi:hypothetical protein N9A53_04360 [Candidatus Pelagibacter ubique]|jgi:hypothetical protein|nr:hypothetical protein [Candidatus Pelagibacter ubique]
MSIVYSIIWLLGILLTLFWLIGSFFKPAKMGGKETWGTTNFKASMLWSLSLVFVFIFKLNSINLLILLPLGMVISGSTSTKALVDFSIKNNLKPDEVENINLPDTSGLLHSLLAHIFIMIVIYFINHYFFS